MQNIEIIVKGELDPTWSEWLEGLTISHTTDQNTRICGQVADQSALYGLLSRLRDMGLSLISVVSSEQSEAFGKSENREAFL